MCLPCRKFPWGIILLMGGGFALAEGARCSTPCSAPLAITIFFFWRSRVCWPLLCLCRSLCIFERCLVSKPESCRSKQVRCQLSHLSPVVTHLPYSPISLSHPPSKFIVIQQFWKIFLNAEQLLNKAYKFINFSWIYVLKKQNKYYLKHNSTHPHPLPATHCLYKLYFDFGKGGGMGEVNQREG